MEQKISKTETNPYTVCKLVLVIIFRDGGGTITTVELGQDSHHSNLHGYTNRRNALRENFQKDDYVQV